jgi:solute carrier family 25 folate transporter 32
MGRFVEGTAHGWYLAASMTSSSRLSYFGSPALDHAVAGIGAGTATVLCVHPLDLLKVKFQVATAPPAGGIGKQIWLSLRDVWIKGGIGALYRGVSANVAGNASSWGLYFWLFVKKYV